jgi:hypothetical protein
MQNYKKAQADQLKELLLDKLSDDIEICNDDFGDTYVELPNELGIIRISPKGDGIHYKYEIWVGKAGNQSLFSKSIDVPIGKLIENIFGLCDASLTIEKLKEKNIADSRNRLKGEDAQDADFQECEDAEDIDEKNVYQYFKNEAGKMGKSKDILKNKDLYSLQTLVKTTPAMLDIMPSAGFQLLKKRVLGEQIEPVVKPTTNGEVPISLNENRDVSKPYQNTLGNKTMILVDGRVEFVNKEVLEEAKSQMSHKLSWTPEEGCVLINSNEKTQMPKAFSDIRNSNLRK